jgi:hypothetical protein
MPAQRGKLADGDSVPGHDKRLALIKLAHDVTAVIAQLPLSDLFGHTKSVARVLHCPSRCQPLIGRGTGNSGFGVGRGGLHGRGAWTRRYPLTPLLRSAFHRERRNRSLVR